MAQEINKTCKAQKLQDSTGPSAKLIRKTVSTKPGISCDEAETSCHRWAVCWGRCLWVPNVLEETTYAHDGNHKQSTCCLSLTYTVLSLMSVTSILSGMVRHLIKWLQGKSYSIYRLKMSYWRTYMRICNYK